MNKVMANSSKPGNGKLIYVVDDEPMLLELATVILEPLGYEVQTFRDPGSALKAYELATIHPTLVITDYAMHSMTGMDLLRGCRRIQPQQRVLLVSGTVGEEVFQKSPLKPNRFLAKPYHARQLIDMVESLIKE